MEPKNGQADTPKGGVTRPKLLPIGRRVTKTLGDEAEMRELERMVGEGELEAERVADYIKEQATREK